MTPQQRFLLAMSLTLGVLLAWSLLVPSPPSPKLKEAAKEILPIEAAQRFPEEPVIEFSLGPWRLNLAERSAGVRGFTHPGAELFVESDPGIFQVDLLYPAEEISKFNTTFTNGLLLSESELRQGQVRLVREVSLSREHHNFLLECNLILINRSQENQDCQLKVVVYRLLKSLPQERQFLYGAVFLGEKMYPIRLKEGQSRGFASSPRWITSQGKSFCMIVQPVPPFGLFHVEHSPLAGPVGWLELPRVTLAPGEETQWQFRLYAGPMNLSDLRKVGLEGAISFGFFSGITRLLLEILTWSQGWLHNYGLAILFLSVGIWLLFFPLTWSGIRMMKVMGQLQPQIEQIRKTYQKNPQRINQEILQLYRKHRVNPLSGCLPLLFQMPIFISLYQVLSRSPLLQGAGFLWIRDLSSPDALLRFPSEVPLIGKSLNLLPILMVGVMFLQQGLTQKSQVVLTEEQRIQQQFFRFFPLLFGFLFYGLPSGLVLYWVTNTVLSVIQQILVLRIHRG